MLRLDLFLWGILLLLGGIYGYFKPLEYTEYVREGEIPKVEAHAFILHEIESNGISYTLEGDQAAIFEAYYTVFSVKFSDNTGRFLQDIRGDRGVIHDKNIDLMGHVLYTREDGLAFQTQHLYYNRHEHRVYTPDPYLLTQENHRMHGVGISMDTHDDVIESSAIEGTYQLK